jgi:preprotein translocase subunit YajC
MTWSDAYAQTGPAPSGNDALLGQLISFAPIILMFVIIYFLMIRPQQARAKQTAEMIKALKKGDKVLTQGGIIGTVWGVDDDKAVVKIGDDLKVEFVKSAIVQVLTPESKPT